MSLRWLHQAWAALALMYILFFVLALISAQVPAVFALVYRSLSQLLRVPALALISPSSSIWLRYDPRYTICSGCLLTFAALQGSGVGCISLGSLRNSSTRGAVIIIFIWSVALVTIRYQELVLAVLLGGGWLLHLLLMLQMLLKLAWTARGASHSLHQRCTRG